jgi:hypothetical protein
MNIQALSFDNVDRFNRFDVLQKWKNKGVVQPTQPRQL